MYDPNDPSAILALAQEYALTIDGNPTNDATANALATLLLQLDESITNGGPLPAPWSDVLATAIVEALDRVGEHEAVDPAYREGWHAALSAVRLRIMIELEHRNG